MPAGKLEFSMKFLTQRIAPRSSTRLLTLNSTILPLWGTGKPRSLYETRASGAMMLEMDRVHGAGEVDRRRPVVDLHGSVEAVEILTQRLLR